MKNLSLVILFAIASGAIGKVPPEQQMTDEVRNPLAEIGLDIFRRDTIPRDSMVFFTIDMTIYRPRFAAELFIVAKGRDELHEFIFMMNGSNFIKLEPKEMKGLAYKVETFEYGGELGAEDVYIDFKVANVYFHYFYDINLKKFSVLNK